MKKVNIKTITKGRIDSHYIKDRLHTVALGNGVIVEFSNINAARRFISETNRFLNRCLFELNNLYIETFSEYRNAWFIAPGSFNIINRFSQIENSFNLIVDRAAWVNGNHFTFIHLINICNLLNETIKQLNKVYKARRQYNPVNRLYVIQDRINDLIGKINNYAKMTKGG